MLAWGRGSARGGCSSAAAGGTGKTTLARQIAARTGAPSYDLDAVGYEGGAGRKRPLGDRLADVRRIATQPAWVVEGGFLWWTDELLAAADTIVWLDLPWRVAAWRIVLRHVKADLAGTNRHPGLRRLWRFFRYIREYHTDLSRTPPRAPDDDGAVTRAHVAAALAHFGGKVEACRSPRDVRRLLRRFG